MPSFDSFRLATRTLSLWPWLACFKLSLFVQFSFLIGLTEVTHPPPCSGTWMKTWSCSHEYYVLIILIQVCPVLLVRVVQLECLDTTGLNGADGAPGSQGLQGPQGDTGHVGPAGPRGETGAAGSNGMPGQTGASGSPGAWLNSNYGADSMRIICTFWK